MTVPGWLRPTPICVVACGLLWLFLRAQSSIQPAFNSRAGPQTSVALHDPLKLLDDALARLENAPILSVDEAIRQNERTCGGKERQSNPDQIKGERTFWDALSAETIRDKRRGLIRNLRAAYKPQQASSNGSTALTDPMFGSGRGIVYTGGNADTLHRLLLSLRFLRERHGCTLPVEVFSFPEEMTDSPGQGLRGEIEALGNVTFKELRSSAKLELWKNFQIKGESIVKSSFQEVLYLDSDNILLADPTFLFDHHMYKPTGAVMWPDITRDGPRNPAYRLLGTQCPGYDWQIDSGQMVFNKRAQNGLVYAALLLAADMQKDHKFWFKISGGDKDTFRYAFYALGLDYTPAPHWLSSFGTMHGYDTEGHTFCGLAMFHYGLSPADWQYYPDAEPDLEQRISHAPPLFVHANLLKHGNGYNRGQTFTAVKRYEFDRVDHALEKARSIVYTSLQGMCVDLWDDFEDQHYREDGSYNDGNIKLESAADAFGGILKDFEQIYYDAGGRAGGF